VIFVFGTYLEVAHDDGNFCAGGDKDEEHTHQETEDIVDLMEPQGRHDEEELDADGAKRQDATQSNREQWVSVPHLLRNVPAKDGIEVNFAWIRIPFPDAEQGEPPLCNSPGNLVGPHGDRHGVFLESKVTPYEYQW